MPNYTPIEAPTRIRSSYSDVLGFHWRKDGGISSDFLIPGDVRHLLRITFDRAEVVRLLDEMSISTEADTPNVGLVPDHLAYEVSGSAFWNHQSEAMKLGRKALKHYRFITGGTCIDVLSESGPTFAVAQLQ
jgi:hypothetical protein